MRPTWCPHPDCIHLTGGGDAEGSGVACGGRLPAPEEHGGTENTHRLCIKPHDQVPCALQVNAVDLWYLCRVVESLTDKAKAAAVSLLAAALLLLAPLAWGDTEDQSPDGTTTSTDNSCTTGNAHTTLDDDVDAPGGDWCTATTCGGTGTSSPVWHLTLPTPTGNPTTGTDEQVMAAHVRLCGTATSTPTCRLDAYCAGSLVLTGAEQNVTSETGQDITQAWTFSTGSCAADGSDVEVRLTCTSSGGSPNDRRTGDADAVEWRVNYSVGSPARGAIIIARLGDGS